MSTLVRFLLIFCVVFRTTGATHKSGQSERSEPGEQQQHSLAKGVNRGNVAAGRSIAQNYEDADGYALADLDPHAAFKKRAKPLKNIFMGIYKNYKSTYLGNKTSLEYKQKLRDRISAQSPAWEAAVSNWENSSTLASSTSSAEQDEEGVITVDEQNASPAQLRTESTDIIAQTELPEVKESFQEQLNSAPASLNSVASYTHKQNKKRRKRKRKYGPKHKRVKAATPAEVPEIAAPAGGDDPLVYSHGSEYRYNVGPGVNMSLDMQNDIVSVNMDGNNLIEVMRERWLSDNTDQGRSRKYDMVTKVLPLFILPFLIQSAIVPFLVTKLKLLLMKSILVGKLAIFLLIVSAIKNSNKMMQTYEVAPSYWAGEPSRRSELGAVAPSVAYNGYRVEGKPAAWIN